MPRCFNRNPRYSRHKASGQAVVTMDGRDFYLGTWKSKSSRLEYDRLIAEWLNNGRRAPNPETGRLTVAELIERYWQHSKEYYRHPDGSSTSELYPIKSALHQLNRLYGLTIASDFGPLAIQALRNSMIELGWCRSTINKQVSRIKSVFKWGIARELIPSSVYHGLQAVSGLRAGRTQAREPSPVRPVPDEIVDATLPFLSSVVRAMVQVQRYTGARPGEICAMRVGEIDRSTEVWTCMPSTHKTAHHGHSRVIFIGPKAQEILSPFLLKLDPEAFVFSPAEAVREMRQRRSEERRTRSNCGNFAGSNRKCNPKRVPSERYNVPSYRRAVTRAADNADLWAKGGRVIANDQRVIPHWHPHRLRHSAATEIRRKYGIEAAQHVLGHASTTMTEVYAERNAEAARQIAAQIG
jgi:integrase